jgi:hypothetical protein
MAMKTLTCKLSNVAIIFGVLLTGSGCSDDEPEPINDQQPSVITVMVSEAGAPGYVLHSARVVDANYRTGSPSMSIIGTLNNGKTLNVRFNNSGNATAYTTNAVVARLDGVTGTAASGTTSYSIQTQTVDGSFEATFPGVGLIRGSFAGIQL